MHNRDELPINDFDSFEQLFDQLEERTGYWAERAKLEFTREVLARMEQCHISRSSFASKLGVAAGMVTRLLSGRNNFEIETMVRMAKALNCRFRSHLEPEGANTVWFDVLNIEVDRGVSDNWNTRNFSSVVYFPTMKHVNYEASSLAA